jgi:flavin-dependent dehydrogenase
MMVKDQLETDIVVIGGGPAGLAAAIAARRKGFRVMVIEGARPAIDKSCGEGLMPDGVAALGRLGVKLPLDLAIPFRGIRFVEGESSVDAVFPNGCGLGMRRTILHESLIQHASEAGVAILWGTLVKGANETEVAFNGSVVRSRWVIGADGEDSRVRKWAGLDRHRSERLRFGFRRHYRVAPWTDFVEVHWGPKCQIVITPVGQQEVCAALLTRNQRLRVEDAIPLFPALSKRLKDATATTAERGAISALRVLNALANHRFALVGDASGSVDAITGEGLCLAFQQALLLADALEHNNLLQYAAAHQRLARFPTLMSRLMVTIGQHATVRKRVQRTFVAKPRIFSQLLDSHVGVASPATSNMGNVFKLGWQVLMG